MWHIYDAAISVDDTRRRQLSLQLIQAQLAAGALRERRLRTQQTKRVCFTVEVSHSGTDMLQAV